MLGLHVSRELHEAAIAARADTTARALRLAVGLLFETLGLALGFAHVVQRQVTLLLGGSTLILGGGGGGSRLAQLLFVGLAQVVLRVTVGAVPRVLGAHLLIAILPRHREHDPAVAARLDEEVGGGLQRQHVAPAHSRLICCHDSPVRWNASVHGLQAKRCSSRLAFNVASPRTRFQAVTIWYICARGNA